MRQFAQMQESASPFLTYSTVWDADVLFGCVCDAGWKGYHCAERACPLADDPMTNQQASEIQVFRCDLPTTASGYQFALSFLGHITRPLGPRTRAADLRAELERLRGIGDIGVTYASASGTTSTFCEDADQDGRSDSIVVVEFRSRHGPAPKLLLRHTDGRLLDGYLGNMVVAAYDGDGLVRDGDDRVIDSVRGTREAKECAGRGRCNGATGECECFPGYRWADYPTGPAHATGEDCQAAVEGRQHLITACPGSPSECSGHGRCSGAPSFRCQCEEGWTGGDCGERACPKGRAWFDAPTTTSDVAHQPAECSAAGVCNRQSGVCRCRRGFEGVACERMACPTGSSNGGGGSGGSSGGGSLGLRGSVVTSGTCSGHGRCLTMAALASHAMDNGEPVPQTYGLSGSNPRTWDAQKVTGCWCEPGWAGYDCSRLACPTGDDPSDNDIPGKLQRVEQQKIACEYLGGALPAFRLAFRGEVTRAIPYNAAAHEVKSALEDLSTIGELRLTFSAGAQACKGGGSANTITIEFLTEHGDVPPIEVIHDATTFTATELVLPPHAVETRKGNTDNLVCSGRGRCDTRTGQCACFPGFGASDRKGGAGTVPDCGHRLPYAAAAPVSVSAREWT